MTESARNGDSGVQPGSLTGAVPEQRLPDSEPTVGLIAAIPEEFAAAKALLDEPREHYSQHDPALYMLGELPSRHSTTNHRVVLTQLGATATNAAADGCANLARSFPSVAVVIMVGIAAGVPNPQRPELHVRLGDIVVAREIVDFDHVHSLRDTTQPRRPFPVPSSRLSRGVDMLKVDELSGHRLWEDQLRWPGRTQLAGYGRPPEHTDVLFSSAGYRLEHPRRNLSGHRKGFPKVHYGPIGSADRSLSDAATRDHLATRYGLLAVEMEGAGIGSAAFLNNLEWFVVRGISDYGDASRNGTWRRYASLVAVAYVRALLAKCLPIEPRHGGHVAPSLLP